MHADIVSSVPWSCGFSDGCDHGWHMANYWIQDDGTHTIDKYSDGDHDPVDEDDVPNWQEESQAWKDYYAYVAREGKDPLADFRLPTQQPRKRKWQASIRNWIGSQEHGLRVIGVRRRGRGKFHRLDEAPQAVLDFLFLGHDGYKYGERDLRGCKSSLGLEFKTFADLQSQATNCTLTVRKVLGHDTATLDFEVDELPPAWSEDRVRSYLKRAARKALAEKELR